jgi:four helix bundle protein
MKEENVILTKSYDFANRTVKLYRFLCDDKEFVLSQQLLRSGTSVGANVREAQRAASRKDFVAKLNIALKEAYETEYWLELLRDNSYITEKQFDSMFSDCRELTNILSRIIITSKQE